MDKIQGTWSCDQIQTNQTVVKFPLVNSIDKMKEHTIHHHHIFKFDCFNVLTYLLVQNDFWLQTTGNEAELRI